jgi:hypothetical protein
MNHAGREFENMPSSKHRIFDKQTISITPLFVLNVQHSLIIL